MIGRKIAIGFGTAVLLPLLIFYGVSTYSPPPEYETYSHRQDGMEELETARRDFAAKLFYVAVPVGLGAIVAGGLGVASAIRTGLIFGGIFTLATGFGCYWEFIADWQRFLSLLTAAAALASITFRKGPKAEPST